MQNIPCPSAGETTLAIEGELTIAHVRSRKDQCMAALAAGVRTLDLRDVTHVDGAGLQLLLLLRREADRHGFAFDGVVPSRAVSIALRMVQLDDSLRAVPRGRHEMAASL